MKYLNSIQIMIKLLACLKMTQVFSNSLIDIQEGKRIYNYFVERYIKQQIKKQRCVQLKLTTSKQKLRRQKSECKQIEQQIRNYQNKLTSMTQTQISQIQDISMISKEQKQ
ncbi:unnamed protein product [Paramecium sonneborni]|uniref:Uncharacterized protein n=1 Tax=Paramecium sonneborni TaxID=65129 RepID=A0A8S1NQJ3_9CILI|nr:unnamed protein product [Paramecium sonneborni]